MNVSSIVSYTLFAHRARAFSLLPANDLVDVLAAPAETGSQPRQDGRGQSRPTRGSAVPPVAASTRRSIDAECWEYAPRQWPTWHGGATVPLMPRQEPLVTTGPLSASRQRVRGARHQARATARYRLPQGCQPPDPAPLRRRGLQRAGPCAASGALGSKRAHRPRPRRHAPHLQGV